MKGTEPRYDLTPLAGEMRAALLVMNSLRKCEGWPVVTEEVQAATTLLIRGQGFKGAMAFLEHLIMC